MGYADEWIRLLVSLHLPGDKWCHQEAIISIRLQGTPRHCLRKLQVEALSVVRWNTGVRLIPRTDFGSYHYTPLSPEHLYSASVFGGGRLDLELQSCKPWEKAEKEHRTDHLCGWLVPSVRQIQRMWRAKLSFRYRSDIQDILQTFSLLVHQRSFRFFRAEVLGKSSAQEAEVFPLVLAAAASGYYSEERTGRVFKILEAKASVFCLRHATRYLEALRGLDSDGYYILALQDLTRQFLNKLGKAFPWFSEPAWLQDGVCTALEAAKHDKLMRKSKGQLHGVPFVKAVWSAVLIWVLHELEDALSSLQRHFSDEGIQERLSRLPKARELLEKAFVNLSEPRTRPWLVCTNYMLENGSSAALITVLRHGENFGQLLQSAWRYFGIESGQLLHREGVGEPLAPEESPKALDTAGLLLHLVLKPHAYSRSSLDHCIGEIAKVVGSRFALQRGEHVLHLPSSHAASKIEGVSSFRVLLPNDGAYASEDQFYHIYCDGAFKLLTLRCNLSSFVRWVEDNCADMPPRANCADAPPPTLLDSAALLEELQNVQSKVAGWIKSTCGSGLKFSSRTCSSAFSLKDIGASKSVPRSDSQTAAAIRPSSSSTGESSFADFFAWACGSTSSADSRTGASSDAVHSGSGHGTSLADFFAWPCESASSADSSIGASSDAVHSGSGHGTSSGAGSGSGRVTSQGADNRGEETEQRVGELFFSPEVVRPAAIGATACASQMMAIPPTTAFVMSPVQAVLGNGAVLLSPSMDSFVSNSVASVSGAIGGAALGGVMGRGGAAVGSLCGGAIGNKAFEWIQAQPQMLHLSDIKGYVLTHSPSSGQMYLHHKATVQGPGNEAIVLVVLLQASMNGVKNLWSYTNGQMSGTDMATSFLKDVRDGALLVGSSQMTMKVLQACQQHAAGSYLATLSTAALHHPVPVLIGALATGYMAAQGARCYVGAISAEQLRADSLLTVTVNGAGIMTNVVCVGMGLPFMSCALLTCTASNFAGLWAYEAWRLGQQEALEEKLFALARNVFGLCPGYDKSGLNHRWRTLALMAHPDKNRRADAKTTFIMLKLCKDILEMKADAARPRPRRSMFLKLVQLSQRLPRWMSTSCS